MPALPPDADAVRAQLERILASPGFANADRLSRFLRFVVERTLDGEGDQLKEYRLGTEVFDRPPDYDPRLDSIVRVEARRLRSKLAEYYEGPGRTDPTVIRVDKGGYAAAFETAAIVRTVATAPAPTPTRSADGLRLGPPGPAPARWLPFAFATAAVVAAVLHRLDHPVARHRLGVVAHPGGGAAARPLRHHRGRRPRGAGRRRHRRPDRRARPASGRRGRLAHQRDAVPRPPRAALDHRQHAHVQAVVEGRVQVTGSRLWVEVRLVDARRDRKIWVDDFAGSTSDRRELERRVAAALARVLTARFPSGVE